MDSLLVAAYLAGLVTVLTPCVLPFLPVILGGSLGSKSYVKPVVIIVSLGISIILFGILFQASTKFLGLSRDFWIQVSAVIIVIFGLVTLFPGLWEHWSGKLKFGGASQKLLATGSSKHNIGGAVLMGLALGPVFSGCSPTFVLILSIIIPASFLEGVFYLWIYTLGIGTLLALIAIFGQALVKRLQWATNPKGWFKRVLGLILVVMGVIIFFGWEKKAEAYLLSKTSLFEGITNIEIQIKDRINKDKIDDLMGDQN